MGPLLKEHMSSVRTKSDTHVSSKSGAVAFVDGHRRRCYSYPCAILIISHGEKMQIDSRY